MPEVSPELVFALPFFGRALIAGLILAVLAGTLGVLVVVRGMAFFADAIAHASLAGIALGVLLSVDPLWAALGFSVLVGLGIATLSRGRTLKLDTIIGVFYSAAVALGVVIISTLKGVRVDLVGLLFGDILGISTGDIILAAVLAAVILGAFMVLAPSVMQLSVSRELAKVNGVRVTLVDFIFMVLLAVTVSVGIQLVGVILIGPLLIMPAAAAKNVSRSFLGTLIGSIVVGVLGVVVGLVGSVYLDVPAGPAVVLTMALLFGGSLLLGAVRRS